MRVLVGIAALSFLLAQGSPFYQVDDFDSSTRTVVNDHFWVVAAIEAILLALFAVVRWADKVRYSIESNRRWPVSSVKTAPTAVNYDLLSAGCGSDFRGVFRGLNR
jgi:hypothetical protein